MSLVSHGREIVPESLLALVDIGVSCSLALTVGTVDEAVEALLGVLGTLLCNLPDIVGCYSCLCCKVGFRNL
jgi:hypothetical protein